MFHWPFGRERKKRQVIVDALYEKIVEAARRPAFYSEWDVPDTALGRYEMLSLHFVLFLHRVRGKEGALKDVAQEITDHFFQDLDHSLREFGIGDTGVPKRMKKLARMFYGRVAAYEAAIDSGDHMALSNALMRNIMPEKQEWPWSSNLAAYILRANQALSDLTDDDLAAGRIEFAALEQE